MKEKEIITRDYDKSPKLREKHDEEMRIWREEQSKKRKEALATTQKVKKPNSTMTCTNPEAKKLQEDTYICDYGEVAFCPNLDCNGIIKRETYEPWGKETEVEINRCEKCHKTYSDGEVRGLLREAKPLCPKCNKPLTQQQNPEYFECMTKGCIDRGHVYHQTEVDELDRTVIEYTPAWIFTDENGDIERSKDQWVVAMEMWKCPFTNETHRISGHHVCKTCGYREFIG